MGEGEYLLGFCCYCVDVTLHIAVTDRLPPLMSNVAS